MVQKALVTLSRSLIPSPGWPEDERLAFTLERGICVNLLDLTGQRAALYKYCTMWERSKQRGCQADREELAENTLDFIAHTLPEVRPRRDRTLVGFL